MRRERHCEEKQVDALPAAAAVANSSSSCRRRPAHLCQLASSFVVTLRATWLACAIASTETLMATNASMITKPMTQLRVFGCVSGVV